MLYVLGIIFVKIMLTYINNEYLRISFRTMHRMNFVLLFFLLIIIIIYVIDWFNGVLITAEKINRRKYQKRSNESYHRLRAIIFLWLLVTLLPFKKNVPFKYRCQISNYCEQADVLILSPFIIESRDRPKTFAIHWNDSA